MPKYMLLLYAGEGGPDQAEREAEMPRWMELTRELGETGMLVSTDRLHPVDMATTVRVRDGETEIVDGPFAVTKEFLGGYYVLDCPDLDEALKQASRMPLARYGSVEIRPLMDVSAIPSAARATTAEP